MAANITILLAAVGAERGEGFSRKKVLYRKIGQKRESAK